MTIDNFSSEFSLEIAQSLYSSVEQFPVIFDDAWVWLEYSRKDNAKASFLKCGFVEGVDYVSLKIQENSEGRPVERLRLSCECLKQWGMMAGTSKGKQVRMYFLECERLAKEFLKPQVLQEVQPSVKDDIDILNQCLAIANLRPELISGIVLNHAASRMPHLTTTVNEAHKLLAATTKSMVMITPTTIGKHLKVSGRVVNLLLLELGYQIKNTKKTSKTEPDYVATEVGLPYASNTTATGKVGDDGTYQHLKWDEKIIDILREQMPQEI